MKKWVIFMVLGILVIVIIGIFIIYIKKECKIDDDCLSKNCFTVQCKDNKCIYSPIVDCCGNEMCEVGETYPECVADCPDCDDVNECTKDSYDYHEQRCVNTIIPNVICCGNSVCETGENYENCAQDCPNCDDNNNCTIDSYDYHEQKCINEPIVPCCGNGICDENAETYLNCSTDCPNCDDDNKLTGDSFNYETQKCENIVTHYFIDDFEEGTQMWALDKATAWSTIVEDGNTILRGTAHNWARLEGQEWTDYIFKFRFKIITGLMHANFRFNSSEGGINAYYVGLDDTFEEEGKTVICLTKSTPAGPNLLQPHIPFSFEEGWHTLEIRGYGNVINVYIDDKLLIKYKDTENPILFGKVVFQVVQGEFLIDDVEIKVITEKDIVYP